MSCTEYRRGQHLLRGAGVLVLAWWISACEAGNDECTDSSNDSGNSSPPAAQDGDDSDENKAITMLENMAALAETHRHDCPAMGQALSSFVEENRLEYEELNARIFERGREGRAQCEQDERSAMCENYHIHVWNTAEFLIRGRVADDKLKFYGNWCVQDEQVREALITWQKVMSEARQRRHETEGK